jgi:hypothetical protein
VVRGRIRRIHRMDRRGHIGDGSEVAETKADSTNTNSRKRSIKLHSSHNEYTLSTLLPTLLLSSSHLHHVEVALVFIIIISHQPRTTGGLLLVSEPSASTKDLHTVSLYLVDDAAQTKPPGAPGPSVPRERRLLLVVLLLLTVSGSDRDHAFIDNACNVAASLGAGSTRIIVRHQDSAAAELAP